MQFHKQKSNMTIKILGFNGAGLIPVSEKTQGNKKKLLTNNFTIFKLRLTTGQMLLYL
jgi:hypothetical protein